jgi:hypothetical protein
VEDCDVLVSAFPDLAEGEKTYGHQERERLLSKFQAAIAEATPARPVVMHLTALAAVRDGVIYILPAHARPGDSPTWLKLDTVLDALRDCKAKHLLLLLDLAHPTADLFHGPLDDRVADRLDEHLQARTERGDLPFFVLTSCSKGELSLPMPEEQQSAFAFYIAEGLRGAADGAGPSGQRDGRVRVTELAEFVKRRVSRWARDCRGLRQTPQLRGNAQDFDLTNHPLPPLREGEAAPLARPYPPWLLDGWKRRDDWLAKGYYRSAPAAFNGLQAALVRAEREWQSTARLERVDRELKAAIGAISPDGSALANRGPPGMRSVAAWPMPPNPPAELSSSLEQFLIAALNPKEADKAKEIRTKFLEKAKTPPESRKLAAGLIWRRLLDDADPKPETIAALSALLDEVPPEATSEAQAARRLATWRRPGGTPWPAAAVRQLLQTEDAANRALAAAPVGFPAAADLFATAVKYRDEGEDLLFKPSSRNPADQASAADLLHQAETKFVAALNRMAAIQNAHAVVEYASIVLPATAGRVADEGREADQQAWFAAAKTAAELFGRFDQAPTGGEFPLGDWEDGARRLREALQALEGPYQPAAVKRRLDDLAAARAPEYQALADLLRGPMLAADDRKRVWDAGRTIAERLHKQTREADAVDNDALRPAGSNRSPDPPLNGEADRRDRRASVSIELLRVAGFDHADALDEARRNSRNEPAKWQKLADDLRAAWTAQLPQRAKAKRDGREWAAADRLERFLQSAPAGATAAVEVRRRDESAFLAWLEQYYRGLGRLRQSVAGAGNVYADAAEDARRGRGD